ncbi:MAG: GNAT family N-acetyltransferase [Nocardioidaceae bacterium]|nr:GNAT family N-acetyltransferase [Nocardioidaceae bacterium]
MTKSGLGSSLGPAVVGQRVVVRRILPGEAGPTGGPAFTDVLGTCESWGEDTMTVRTEDGTLVTIATADIVSGKPVPPRPSIRQRVSAREAESHAEPHWPGVRRTALGEWQLRIEPEPKDRPGRGPRKRANSCLAMGDPGMAPAEAAHAVRDFYDSHDRTPMVQVEAGSEVEDWFAASGWSVVPGGDALFLLGSLARARRLLGVPVEEAVVTADGPRAQATLGERAFGNAALDGDWLGVHDLEVEQSVRRRGLARAVLSALLEWGAEQGATTVWLHVETGNEPAIALYETLGLAEHHGCRYYALTPGR